MSDKGLEETTLKQLKAESGKPVTVEDKVKIYKRKDLRFDPIFRDYDKEYAEFRWEDHLDELDWIEKYKSLNPGYEAIDRHAKTWRKNKVSLYWEGVDGTKKEFTYLDIKHLSNKFANVLKSLGIERGDVVAFFLPRVPEIFYGPIGAAKAGVVFTMLFSGFGPSAVRTRLKNSGAKAVVTTGEGIFLNPDLKKYVYMVMHDCPELKHIIVVGGGATEEEVDLQREMRTASRDFKAEPMDPEDPFFIIYTSGTTGAPKGPVHVQMCLLGQLMTTKWIFDLRDEDIFWCTADPGWITGVSYILFGPNLLGASQVIYEGRFSPEKWYRVIQDYSTTVLYTTPTALRLLMGSGKELPKKYDFGNLRLVGSVGEPLNPEPARWAMEVFDAPLVDTWWQSETGHILITPFLSTKYKPGSMGRPFPGIRAAIVDENGKALPPGRVGDLVIKPIYPGMFRTCWRNPERYNKYFLGDWYISGDAAVMDEDGFFWYAGRADDMIKSAGYRIGPFEVESALVEHPAVAEAAVVAKPDPVRGAIPKSFIVLSKGYEASDELKKKLEDWVKRSLGGHARPREFDFVSTLPRTRSGKIMRRLLKNLEAGLPLGDITTLEDHETFVREFIEKRKKRHLLMR